MLCMEGTHVILVINIGTFTKKIPLQSKNIGREGNPPDQIRRRQLLAECANSTISPQLSRTCARVHTIVCVTG